jgi:hypothetical protein|tara:strand:+ start:785 stop:1327 length:543 start_codon:yes stop_codon:yes gene_type:complete
MQKLMMVAVATILMSTTAMGGERKVTVPTPKSITLICSDDVRQGTVVLSNPPKFSCKDYDLVTKIVGTGITVGPDANVNRITAALRRANNRGNNNSWNTTKTRSLDDFYGNRPELEKWLTETGPRGMEDKFQGTTRNIKWFNEVAPIKVSNDPSGRCSGWINLNDILSGKCGSVQVNMNK